jgi:hypothetical protein
MKKILYGLVCLTTFVAFQGCFWHSSEHDVVPAGGQSSTTVVTPQPVTTTTTTNP